MWAAVPPAADSSLLNAAKDPRLSVPAAIPWLSYCIVDGTSRDEGLATCPAVQDGLHSGVAQTKQEAGHGTLVTVSGTGLATTHQYPYVSACGTSTDRVCGPNCLATDAGRLAVYYMLQSLHDIQLGCKLCPGNSLAAVLQNVEIRMYGLQVGACMGCRLVLRRAPWLWPGLQAL